ncbi:MAG TPA: hypothetical protein VFP40_06025 [Terriglobales bacterium]|nr:hypothetical protein [Terriglobales bacterium]
MTSEWHSSHIVAPKRGQLIRDYVLLDAAGKTVQLTDFRGKWNLLIVLLPSALDAQQTQLLQSLAEKSSQVRENETRVLVVTRPEHLATVVNLGDDFLVLSDSNGSALLELAAFEAPVFYITDKFREVLHRIDVHEQHPLPSAEELVSWTEFAAMQCPECHPPEWPADEAA